MKAALFSIILGVGTLANAATTTAPAGVDTFVSASKSTPSFEAANRKGSKRVGGSGRSGKGGKYVGGRRR